MYKIIGADQKQYGPVSAEQLLQWVREGRVNGQTLVSAEGTTDWRPLSAFPELAAPIAGASGPAPGMIPPAYNPTPPAGPVTAAAIENSIPADYDLDIGGCISAAWNLLKNNFGTICGATAVYLLIQGAVSGLGNIPLIGFVFTLASMIINGPLTAGAYYFFIRAIRGQQYDIGNIFEGFKRNFGQNILGYIVCALLTLAAMLPGAALAIVPLIGYFRSSDHLVSAVSISLVCGGILLAIIPAMYLGVCWLFTLPLIMDKGLGFWDAMKISRSQVGKHFWTVLGLLVVAGLLNVGGVMLCCVGIFVTMPLMLGALMYGYETLFRNTAAPVTGPV